MRHAILFLMLTLLAGCSLLVSSRDKAFAQDIIEAARTGNFGRVDAAASPELRKVLTPEAFDAISVQIPAGTPRLHEVNSGGFGAARTLTYEISDEKRHALVHVIIAQSHDRLVLLGLSVRPLAGRAPLPGWARTLETLRPYRGLFGAAFIMLLTWFLIRRQNGKHDPLQGNRPRDLKGRRRR